MTTSVIVTLIVCATIGLIAVLCFLASVLDSRREAQVKKEAAQGRLYQAEAAQKKMTSIARAILSEPALRKLNIEEAPEDSK